jgi:hypothetical protein
MIAPPAEAHIWIAAGVTDLRRGFTGLSALVQTALEQDPFARPGRLVPNEVGGRSADAVAQPRDFPGYPDDWSSNRCRLMHRWQRGIARASPIDYSLQLANTLAR